MAPSKVSVIWRYYEEGLGVDDIDKSGAFDVVDHSILIDNLKLYGFDDGAVGWMANYLSGR